MGKKRGKHSTPFEKTYFLHILSKFKHIIEWKKSNISTLRDKETAWANLCEEFNQSSRIMQERNVRQLKKLWSNIKQAQRDILTKEKQSRFATGGGPEIPSAEVDPDVAALAPNLMTTAPILFSYNMDDNEVENERQVVQNVNKCKENYVRMEEDINNASTSNEKQMNDNDNEVYLEIDRNDNVSPVMDSLPTFNEGQNKRRKCTETEEDLKVLRVKNVMQWEQQLALIKHQYEERMAKIKEEHLKKLNELEIRAALAKAELAELLLEKEKARVS